MNTITCANCGRKISQLAIPQGILGAATISMILCRFTKCNLKAVKFIKRMLRTGRVK